MLQFIMGRSGSGKTQYVYDMLAKKVINREEKLLMIVPEQLSFETEKTFLDMLGGINSRKIQVLSFSRMVDFVFRQIGGLSGRAIDDGGRSIIMSLAIEQAQDNLELYKKQVNRPELAKLMLTAVKEFKMCCISTDTLRQTAARLKNTTLQQKLNETALITDIYNSILSKSYIDPLDNLSKLYDALLENPVFHDYTIAIDSFSGFTVAEQRLLSLLIQQCQECYMTITTDQQEYAQKSRRFTTTNNTKKVVSLLAKKAGVKVLPPLYITGNKRTAVPSLQALESNIFRADAVKLDKSADDVSLYCGTDIYSECEYVAGEIKRLAILEDYRYRDIAVIARSLEGYRGILDTIFNKFDIGYFMDKPQDIISKPLITMVTAAFEVIHTSFSSESIFRFLKTGLMGICTDDIAHLENYCYIWNISGSQFKNTFTANPQGYVDKFSPSDTQLLEKLEKLRQQIIIPLIDFKLSITDKTGKEISLAVYKLIQAFNVEKIIKEQAVTLHTKDEIQQAKDLIRIWDIFINALDETAIILQDTYISSKRYSDLLNIVLDNETISFIPRGSDQVIIGTADRVRLNSPKAVFVIGANDGEFPAVPRAGGIFSDIERRNLILCDLPMYDSLEDLSAKEQFFAYSAVSAPSQRLYVTCYEATLLGELKTPSPIINEVINILPQANLIYAKKENPYANLWSQPQAFELAAKNWKANSADARNLRDYFIEIPKYNHRIKALEALLANKPMSIENKQLAKKLFGENMRLSASQVEKFYLCSFQYFCRYGLKAKERKKAQIDSAEYGSLIHYILERILQTPIEALEQMSDTEINTIIYNEMEIYLNHHLGGKDDKTVRYLQGLDRIKATAVTVVKHIIQELSQSMFKPVDFELKIGGSTWEDQGIDGYHVQADDNINVIVQGSVDRVDIYKEQNTSYIRIVDYKTGAKKFVLSDVMFGLNLQMLIYLSAIVKNGGKKYSLPIVPAGVLYMPSGDAYVNLDNVAAQDEIDTLQNKEYRMNGLILKDIDIIKAMEQDGNGVYIPVILKEEKPKKAKKDEPPQSPVIKISKGAQYTVSQTQMQYIFDKIDYLIGNMATSLLQGRVNAVPAKGTYDACAYCPYLSICGYKEGMECRNIVKSSSAFQAPTEEVQ